MRLLVWGTGEYADSFCRYAGELTDCIVGFTETIKSKREYKGKPVYDNSEIGTVDWDYLIIASSHTEEIRKTIRGKQIADDRVISLRDYWFSTDVHDDVIRIDLESSYSEPRDNTAFFAFNGIYFTSKKEADLLQSQYSPSDYWNKYKEFNTAIDVPFITEKQTGLLMRSYLPLLKKTDVLLDYGCASGEWCRLLAPYVARVYGVDISKEMVAKAIDLSLKEGINNIEYINADVTQLDPVRMYDHMLMLGLLIYIEEDQSVEEIVIELGEKIKPGGLLATRSTLTEGERTLYFIKDERNVRLLSTYRPLKWYENLFDIYGFTRIDYEYISQYYARPMDLGVRGFVFKKVK